MLERLARASGFAGSPVVIDEELARVAVREQVAPLLGWRILNGADVAGGRAELVREHRACLAKALVREADLAPMVDAVRAVSPLVWLKGAALRDVYAPGARWMGDLDLLVPPERWRDAVGAAERAGGVRDVVPGRAVTVDNDYAILLRGPRGGVLEVHRDLAPRGMFRVPVDELFARAQGERLEDVDLFLSLAVHAAKHGFTVAFRAVIDGLAVATRVSPDDVMARAAEWRARRAVAIWIRILGRFGLRGWPVALDPVGEAIAARAPYGVGLARLPRIAASLDGLAAVGWAAHKAALRLGDAVLHLRG